MKKEEAHYFVKERAESIIHQLLHNFYIRQHLCTKLQLLYHFNWQGIRGIDIVKRPNCFIFAPVEITQQKQPADAKVGVENITHVAWAVTDATIFLVLALHDEVCEFVGVDPRGLYVR